MTKCNCGGEAVAVVKTKEGRSTRYHHLCAKCVKAYEETGKVAEPKRAARPAPKKAAAKKPAVRRVKPLTK